MIKVLYIFLAFAAMFLVSACGDNKVSFDTLETARAQANENAQFNARTWRAQNPGTAELGMVSRGDSSQAPACPQGDGWATIDLVDTKTGAPQKKLKCSTVSGAVGCRTETDFKSSPFANDDGKCQSTNKVPHPLPKIVK